MDLRSRPPLPLAAALLLALALSACASRQAPHEAPRPDASGWVSPRNRDHPLVGRIWSPRAKAFVDEAALAAAAAEARYLLLGETHDNADHHLGQARLVRAAARGRSPALAFEMLDTGQQPAVDAALAAAPRDALALSRAVGWEKTGWPRFGLYRPVFEAGLAAGLPVVAANLPRKTARAVAANGPGALDPPVRARLERVGPFPDDVMAALREQMAESHCGELPEPMVAPMVLAQKARDAQMAERLAAADRGEGAILVAGRGHARTDVGVPAFLAGEGKGPVVSVAFTEVSDEARSPEEYGAEYGDGPLPFDFVVFTPAAERGDPCEQLRKHPPKMPAATPTPTPTPTPTSTETATPALTEPSR